MNDLTISNSVVIEGDSDTEDSKNANITTVIDGNNDKNSVIKMPLNTINGLTKGTFSKDGEVLVLMTESMSGAKSLLEESKDPLGINDSLYQ